MRSFRSTADATRRARLTPSFPAHLMRNAVFIQKILILATIINSRGSTSLTQSGGSPDTTGATGVTRLNIRVIGRDALVVRNNIADVTASLDLTVTGDTDFPQVTGRITANNGTLFFRNDRYEIVRGILEFPPNTQNRTDHQSASRNRNCRLSDFGQSQRQSDRHRKSQRDGCARIRLCRNRTLFP